MDMKFLAKTRTREATFSRCRMEQARATRSSGKIRKSSAVNKLGFLAVAESYQEALKAGVGEARVLLPDALKKKCSREYDRRAIRANKPIGQSGKRSAH